jgi:mono/diheme cytochrome c family protein
MNWLVHSVALAALLPLGLATAQEPSGPVRQSPAVLNKAAAAELRVGEALGHLTFTNDQGEPQAIASLGKRIVVLAVRDPDCPVARQTAPRLASLQDHFARLAGTRISLVHLFPGDRPLEDMRREMEDHGHRGVLARDPDHSFARGIGLRTTTEVFVFDSAHTLRYRGAVDDQYGIGYRKDAPSRHYLRDAVESVFLQQPVAIAATTAPGCLSEHDAAPTPAPADQEITYHNRISRIIQNHCQTCHRQGGAGPFPLETHAQVAAKRKMIGYVVKERIMPPWGAKHEPGKWLNDPTLSARDEADLLAWLASGAPEGDPSDAPVPLAWPENWQIGTPDLVLRIPEPISIPAEGTVKYQYAKVTNPLQEDRWVKAMELRPSAPQVVHHVLVFRGKETHGGGIGGYFAGLVPGEAGTVFPPDTGKLLPAGETLLFQIHYTTNGRATIDQTELGFIFHDAPPQHEIHTLAAANTQFIIPAGAPNHQVIAEYPVKIPGTLITFIPHTHLRGKAFRYDLIHPDGRTQELIDIPRYDFNWQMRYQLAQPVYAPRGSRIRATAWYDNSAANPANPDPTKNVRHGEQTWEEMMIGYFEAYTGR